MRRFGGGSDNYRNFEVGENVNDILKYLQHCNLV